MKGTQENLPICDLVELDRENPRIRRFLEDYEGELVASSAFREANTASHRRPLALIGTAGSGR